MGLGEVEVEVGSEVVEEVGGGGEEGEEVEGVEE